MVITVLYYVDATFEFSQLSYETSENESVTVCVTVSKARERPVRITVTTSTEANDTTEG